MKLLVTGASGFLGRYLVPELISAGHEVTVLIRKTEYLTGGVRLLKGDVTNPVIFDGHLPNLDGIVHCAGVVSFGNKDRELSHQVNTMGTYNVANLADARGLILWHISTAYVCGDYQGVFKPEMLMVDQGFKNFYEKSKYLAEEMLRTKFQEIDCKIIRPSILVGDSQVKGIPPLMGFYSGVRGVFLAKKWFERSMKLPPIDPEFRLQADPEATLNMIPVDLAAKQIAWLITSRANGTFHVVNLGPPKIKDVLAASGKAIGAIITPVKEFDANPAEKMIGQMAGRILPYLQGEPAFEVSWPVGKSGAGCYGLGRDFIEQTTRKFLLNGS